MAYPRTNKCDCRQDRRDTPSEFFSYIASAIASATSAILGKMDALVTRAVGPVVGAGSGALDMPLAVARAQLNAQGGTVNIASGSYTLTAQPLTGPNVIWDADGVQINGSVPVLPGVVSTLTDTGGKFYYRPLTSPDDGPTFRVQRDATHTGGTVGAVNFAGSFAASVGDANTNHEWALIGRVANYSAASNTAHRVGVYGQAFNYADGYVWSGCFEYRDINPVVNPTQGKIGVEMGYFSQGADDNNQRVVLDMPIHNTNTPGGQLVISFGARIGGGFTPFGSTVRRGYMLDKVNFEQGFTTVGAIQNTNPFNAAFAMSNGQRISFSETVERYMRYSSTAAKVQFLSGAVEFFYIGDDGISGAPQGFRSPKFYLGTGGTRYFTSGNGSPEGVIVAPQGSMYTREDGGAATTLYIKESGIGNTGWVAK